MQELKDWHIQLMNEGFLDSDDSLSLRTDDEIYCIDGHTGEAMPIEQAGRPYLAHWTVYRNRPEIKAIIHSNAPATQTFSHTGRNLKPLLDDFAQIVGPSARCAIRPKQICSKLKSRNAVLLLGDGALCAAPSLDDAYATALVLEKNARAQIEGSFLGGAKRISSIEALFMRRVYLTRYSKADANNKIMADVDFELDETED